MSHYKEITDFFGRDHHRLDALLSRCLACEDETQAWALFRAFRKGIIRHAAWEEELLFPLFEQKTGWVDIGPVVGFKAEHRRIIRLLDKIETYSLPGEAPELLTLQSVLACHNHREERLLYPSIDDDCTEPELKNLLAALYDDLVLAEDIYLVS